MKKTTYILILLMSVSFLCNCKSTEYKRLEDDNLVKKYFSKNEIKDLRTILNFFENEISEGCDKNARICFEEYLKKAGTKYLNNDLGINEEKQEYILENISDSLFDKIWYYGKREDENNTKIIMIKPESKYTDFIRELGKSRKHIEEYYNAASGVGAVINAGTINYVFQNYAEFNLKDEKEKLILAIHYLTLNSIFF